MYKTDIYKTDKSVSEVYNKLTGYLEQKSITDFFLNNKEDLEKENKALYDQVSKLKRDGDKLIVPVNGQNFECDLKFKENEEIAATMSAKGLNIKVWLQMMENEGKTLIKATVDLPFMVSMLYGSKIKDGMKKFPDVMDKLLS